MQTLADLYIGLMSGTSMDGVDGVLIAFADGQPPKTLASAYIPFPAELRLQLEALQTPGDNEVHREAIAANALSELYAEVVAEVLRNAGIRHTGVRAIGAHGQTIRHRPDCGYTRQIANPALLAELTGIDVVADFRSRDIAAGGQGAPLVPAFHEAVFGDQQQTRVIANIGGISNISVLPPNGEVTGFDTGPGNVLLDLWCMRHLGKSYDRNGAWAASGRVLPDLLAVLMAEPYLQLPPPKSTGRDLFHADWLDAKLAGFSGLQPVDVQATLAAFTAEALAVAVVRHAPAARGLFVCGGGAHNARLLELLAESLQGQGSPTPVQSTDALGVPPNEVEAAAFAWLALQHVKRRPGNLSAVTGARGPRVLGALYPA